MTFPLVLSAVAALFTTNADSARVPVGIVSPTVLHAPVIGVRARVMADSIVVEKQRHTLTLYFGGTLVRRYAVALGAQPVGDKVRRGDNRTPEGVYHIDARNGQSKFYKSLHISYPDAAHAQRARALGVAAGGDIMIHGLPRGLEQVGSAHRDFDWTEGCIALTNQEVDEIWSAIADGTPIEIKP
jgi:murein L,D-transpeptidase YafK